MTILFHLHNFLKPNYPNGKIRLTMMIPALIIATAANNGIPRIKEPKCSFKAIQIKNFFQKIFQTSTTRQKAFLCISSPFLLPHFDIKFHLSSQFFLTYILLKSRLVAAFLNQDISFSHIVVLFSSIVNGTNAVFDILLNFSFHL